MRRIAAWEILFCMMAAPLLAESESLPYHRFGFEDGEGYPAGELKAAGMQLLQGQARIVRDDESGRYLETVAGNPYASVHFQGERVSRDHKTYYEILVRPSASPMATSEEFMDLDGAVLGFFADGPGGSGTFHAYHALSEGYGYWVSTGVSAAVGPSGTTREWVKIGVCQNLATGTWDLEIDGEAVLTEIGHTGISPQDAIHLWLLGHETQANCFDDLLISPVDPDSLPKNASITHGPAGNLDRTGERRVTRKQSGEDRRRHDADIPAGKAKTAPRCLDFEMDIVGGGTQHGKFDAKNSGTEQNFLLYSPQYDKAGNPLPLKVRIQCDAELAEGVDLSDILWVVTELAKKDDKQPLRVIAKGTFQTGFTQIAEVPSEWANKGTQIQVGTNLVLRSEP